MRTAILAVLNELRAVTFRLKVNDERIIATSEVLGGSYMTVNGRKLLPPYIIKG